MPNPDEMERIQELLKIKEQFGAPASGKLAETLKSPDESLGLYAKYDVKRSNGSSEPGGKHEKCRYFVLDLDHDKHAKEAIRSYASSCEKDYPALADDLRLMLRPPSAFNDVPRFGGI